MPAIKPARRLTLAAGAFAAALALTACSSGNDTPEGAVENFMESGVEDMVNAMLEGDVEGAKEIASEHLCSDDVTSVEEAANSFAEMSQEERDALMEQAGDDIGMFQDFDAEIGDATEDGDTATVEVSITADGETTDETIDLVKEGDEWKVCGMFTM